MSFFAEMLPPAPRARKIVIALWTMVLIAIPIWSRLDASGWDFAVYHTALQELRIGHDPYAAAIAAQLAYHHQLALHPNPTATPPYNYVYSPMTLPLLRLIGTIPAGLSRLGFWLMYAIGALAATWAGMQAVEEHERPCFAFLAPIAVFFPGLLENGVILSGNIAYIVYGAILVTAVLGWKLGRWRWFYLAVLAASCCKAPLLTLLAIPLLSARRQCIPAGLTAAAGLGLFAVQPIIWPVLFRHFLQAIDLQFSNNRDFGSSPAGIFAGFLFDHGLAYSRGGFIFYLLYAVPLFCLLVYLSRKFTSGAFPLTRWIPVLLLGVILLNPRIVEYDLAILTIPLALIVWRLFPALAHNRIAALSTLGLFVMVNIAAFQSWILWKNIACILLVSLFAAGAWQLLVQYQLDGSRDILALPEEHAPQNLTAA
jgi:hypothetical protein